MRKLKETIAIIGEGITEKYFIQSIRDVVVRKPAPIKAKNSSLKELENSILDCIKKGYDRIYCLIDMDNKIKDGTNDHDGNANAYEQLKKRYHNKNHKSKEGNVSLVIMVESYPATEVFFLYYFGFTTAHFTNQSLKAHLNQRFGYRTEERYFFTHSIHDTLVSSGGAMETAISASEASIKHRDNGNIHCTYTEIGTMISYLLQK